jgi:uncharacterized small protein (DUF1192 family)
VHCCWTDVGGGVGGDVTQATPIDRTRLVDLTETAGHGFLSEMSVAELGERLAMLKSRAEREEAERREQIARAKEEADAELRRKMSTIAIGRSRRGAAPTLAERRAQNAKLAAMGKGRNAKVNELRATLAAKRQATSKRRPLATAR